MKYLIFLVPFLAVLWTSCTKDSKRPEAVPVAYLMVYNGSPDFYGASSTVLSNNSDDGGRTYNDNGGGALGAFNFSRYSFIDPGVYNIAFTDSSAQPGNAAKLSQSRLTFENKKHYTVYLLDSVGFYEVAYTNDDVTPDKLTAKIRLIHLSPDAGRVYVKIDTMAIAGIKDLSYREITDYISVKPDIKPGIRIMYKDAVSGEEKTLVRKSVPLEAGKCYTLILRGYRIPADGNVNKTINLTAITNF